MCTSYSDLWMKAYAANTEARNTEVQKQQRRPQAPLLFLPKQSLHLAGSHLGVQTHWDTGTLFQRLLDNL